MKVLLAEYTVTSDPALAPEGAAMLAVLRRSFERSGYDVLLPETADFAGEIRRLAPASDCGLVIAPDNLLPGYTTILEQFTNNIGCGSMSAAICANKQKSAKILRSHDIPVPDEPGAGMRVVKPVSGCGASGVRLTERPPASGEFSQQFIKGEHLSVSIICNRIIGEACLNFTGEPPVVLAINRQEIVTGSDGTFRYEGGETPVDHPRGDEIRTTAMKAATVLGCQGYCGVDIVLANRPYVVDVNPRITTSIVGIAACLQEEIAALILKAQGPVQQGRKGNTGMIGIDVGGANLKIVDESGVHIHYCPLWEGAPLTELLARYRKEKAEPAAVVMSGELADCFSSKREGISFITRGVRKVYPDSLFYGTDGVFHDKAVPRLAAANWLAAAALLRKDYPDSVLVDVGSTTTDIIPLSRFPELLGLTDLRRLQHGYLLYTGMLRTTLPALLRTVEINGYATPVSSEHFAISADAHLVLGHIGGKDYTCDTPDKKEKTKAAALRRLARVTCADVSEIGKKGAEGIARQFWDIQRKLVSATVREVMKKSGSSSVVTAGIGAGLFASELAGHDLTAELGPAADALPAFAVRELALRERAFIRTAGKGKR